jgi:Zn-dependent peptidase ImmA (M78 family)
MYPHLNLLVHFMTSKKLLVKVEAPIFEYARKYAGLTLEQASQKTKIPVEKLKDYEEKGGDIPINHLEKISEAYKRTLAFFFLLKVPEDAVEPKSFRIVYSSESDLQFSPSAYLAIRRARYVQAVIEELSDKKIEYNFPEGTTIKSDPEQLSTWMRNFVGITFNEQLKWSSSSEALREWKRALETKDIFVIQHSLSKDAISAFCLADKKPYVIALNSAEHSNRRIFSLFHEIGHLLLHQSGICSPTDLSRNSYKYIQIEKFCNQFAASLLLPATVFQNDAGVKLLEKTPFKQWQQEEIGNIASRFRVSREVVVRRFLTLGYIEEDDYTAWRAEWKKTAEEYASRKKGPIKIPQYQKCLSKNGKGFTSFVIEQYHSNRITFTTAADILNIKPKYIQQLEAKLR